MTAQGQLRPALDRFLAGVERRALVTARLACGNPDEALDLVQDAMLAFVRAYAHKPETEWPPLFHRTLQNRIRDSYRRKKVWQSYFSVLFQDAGEEDPLERFPGRPSERPDQQLEQSAATERLLQGVAELPLRQRQALVLRLWEGLDVQQTAQAMGCGSGSVKTHLSRALQNLRARLEEYR